MENNENEIRLADLQVGFTVKLDNGEIGTISRILSTKDNPRGVKVVLDQSGVKGRVVEIISKRISQISNKKVILNSKSLKEKQHFVIDIDKVDIQEKEKQQLFTNSSQKQFVVTTRFFQPAYLKTVKSEVFGVVIFKVKALSVSMAIYKINIYLNKFSLIKDLKYEVTNIVS